MFVYNNSRQWGVRCPLNRNSILCIQIRASGETVKENQTQINKSKVLLLLGMNWWAQHRCGATKRLLRLYMNLRNMKDF